MEPSPTSPRTGVPRRDWLAVPELAPEVVSPRMAGENFPVAARLLPRQLREDLVAVYGAARLIDEAGDSAAGDRMALLDAIETDLRAAELGEAEHPLLRRLTPFFARRRQDAAPFLRLVEANRWDQGTPRLASWAELEAYCALSAQPVGELVLAIFGRLEPANLSDSNAVCSALQLLEHCQDVAEDAAAGRIYLPAEDRARFGCGEADLRRTPAPEALRRTIAFQVERARALLERGPLLLGRLPAVARFCVAGYVAGGLATAEALECHGFDPNRVPVRPRRGRLLGHWLRLATGLR